MNHSTQTWSPAGKVIAIVRLAQYDAALEIARALVAGGIRSLEFTLTGRGALGAIEGVRRLLGDEAQVGAGSVITEQDAANCIAAGAEYLVTPAFRPHVIEVGKAANIPVLCGGFTPSELLDAHEAGAALVKLFPARQASPGYLKDVLAPLPFLRVVPTGGIDHTNARTWLDAGAVAVGIGGKLVDGARVAAQDWDAITAQARLCVDAVG